MSVDQIFDRDTAGLINEYLFAFDMHEQMSHVHRDILSYKYDYDIQYKFYHTRIWLRLTWVKQIFNVSQKVFDLTEKITKIRLGDHILGVKYRENDPRYNVHLIITHPMREFESLEKEYKDSKHRKKRYENIAAEAFSLNHYEPFSFRREFLLGDEYDNYTITIPKLWDDYRISLFNED